MLFHDASPNLAAECSGFSFSVYFQSSPCGIILVYVLWPTEFLRQDTFGPLWNGPLYD
jgi:hypothetical protein